MRKKETPNPSRVRGRGVEVSETLFYFMMPLSRGKDQGEREQDFMSAGGIQ